MSAAAGLDFWAATAAQAWGLDAAPFLPPFAKPVFVTRQFSEFLMSAG
jgi:hypothetical protein